jgi:hypothetical protein
MRKPRLAAIQVAANSINLAMTAGASQHRFIDSQHIVTAYGFPLASPKYLCPFHRIGLVQLSLTCIKLSVLNVGKGELRGSHMLRGDAACGCRVIVKANMGNPMSGKPPLLERQALSECRYRSA